MAASVYMWTAATVYQPLREAQHVAAVSQAALGALFYAPPHYTCAVELATLIYFSILFPPLLLCLCPRPAVERTSCLPGFLVAPRLALAPCPRKAYGNRMLALNRLLAVSALGFNLPRHQATHSLLSTCARSTSLKRTPLVAGASSLHLFWLGPVTRSGSRAPLP